MPTGSDRHGLRVRGHDRRRPRAGIVRVSTSIRRWRAGACRSSCTCCPRPSVRSRSPATCRVSGAARGRRSGPIAGAISPASLAGRPDRGDAYPARKAAGHIGLRSLDETTAVAAVQRHRNVVDEADAHQGLHVDVVGAATGDRRRRTIRRSRLRQSSRRSAGRRRAARFSTASPTARDSVPSPARPWFRWQTSELADGSWFMAMKSAMSSFLASCATITKVSFFIVDSDPISVIPALAPLHLPREAMARGNSGCARSRPRRPEVGNFQQDLGLDGG